MIACAKVEVNIMNACTSMKKFAPRLVTLFVSAARGPASATGQVSDTGRVLTVLIESDRVVEAEVDENRHQGVPG